MNAQESEPDSPNPIPMPAVVGIVGATVAGLALACGLAERGVPSAVFDQHAPDRLQSGPVSLGPRSLEALARWGLADGVRTLGPNLRRVRVFHQGQHLGCVATSELPTRHPVFACPTRGGLRGFLVERARATGLVELAPPARVVGIQADSRRVRILLGDGAARTFRFLAISCSGLRRMLGIPLLPAPTIHLRASGHASGLARDEIGFFLGPSGMAWACPRRDESPFLAAEAWKPGIGPGRLARELRLPAGFLLESESGDSETGVAAAWKLGPLLLLGEGARRVPAGAWRSVDADVAEAEALAWRLDAVRRGAPEALLEDYDSERRLQSLARVTLARNWLPRFSRPGLVRALLPFLQVGLFRHPLGQLLGGLQGALPPSPWCLDERPGRRPPPPLPGMRLPEVRYEDETGRRCWLLDLVGRGCLTLRFGEGPGQVGFRVSGLGERQGVLFDRDGSLQRALKGRSGEILIVRPDGVIGSRSFPEDPRRTAAWLARVGEP